MKQAKKQTIKRENEEMRRRMNNLKSFLSAKELDKNFSNEHMKLVKKLQKVEDGKLLLPNITYRKFENTNHRRSMTESNNMKGKSNYETVS